MDSVYLTTVYAIYHIRYVYKTIIFTYGDISIKRCANKSVNKCTYVGKLTTAASPS